MNKKQTKIIQEQLRVVVALLEGFVAKVIPEADLQVEQKIIQCRSDGNDSHSDYVKKIDLEICKNEFISTGSVRFEKGMNSHGILFDRLTILLCKKYLASQEHFSIAETTQQITDIVDVISNAGLARSPMLAKEATSRIQTSPESFGAVLISLQMSNLLMWINQDLLYTSNVDLEPESRLRDYIKFFGVSNRERNLAIESIDLWMSNKFKGVSCK
jgi:hypothetical protein